MSLPVPNLDDRRFQDLVDEAKRLIPRYCPEWTNHNVSDPGVALIELFAWMSEMVLYRVNQVPEKLFVHFLNLVGIEPFPPSVARADVTFWLTAVVDRAVVVPAGTEVGTNAVGEREPVVFTTTQELVIRPPRLVTAATTAVGDERVINVWDELRYESAPVTCFRSPTLTPGDALLFGFEHSCAGQALRLTLNASAQGIGVDPRNPPLTWEAWVGDAWVACLVAEDTTGGLNRDGDVTILVPAQHEQLTLGDQRAFWLRVRLTEAAPGQATYASSPQIRRVSAVVLGGTVAAEHASLVSQESVGRSVGAPGQTFVVGRTPVLPRRPGETVRVIDLDGATDWTEVADFSDSGPQDRHVVWDSSTGAIHFGPRIRYADGSVRQHGAIPPDGAEILVTGYRTGGGTVGNVGARTLNHLRTNVPFIREVTNLQAASGGVDAETIDEAKARGPLTLRSGQRAVTAGDFERLTREASVEVARARCLPAATPGGAVRVLVVPQVRKPVADHGLDDFAIPAPLLACISDHLDERRLVGTAVEVGTPFYQGLSVATLLRALPGRPAAVIAQRAKDLLTRYINPLVGGPDGNGWPFDTDLNSATLAAMLEAIDGVERVDEVLLFEYDLRTGRRLGSARDVVRLARDSLFLSAAHQVVVR
ncbi:MAG: putative baseplate assembly protein [Actinomycetes bacterium]